MHFKSLKLNKKNVIGNTSVSTWTFITQSCLKKAGATWNIPLISQVVDIKSAQILTFVTYASILNFSLIVLPNIRNKRSFVVILK